MASQEYFFRSFCLILILSACVRSMPSSYLSSMTGGDDGGMTWMGWAPQTGMTAFASSSNPWANRGWKNTGIQPEQTDQDQPEEEQSSLSPPKKWSKGEDQNGPGTSNAQASLNAWFPIMLGLFPPQDGAKSGQREQPSLDSITAVANSVNHGSRGVSSSHAVAYGGEYSKFRHLRNPADRGQYDPEVTDNRQYKTLPKFT